MTGLEKITSRILADARAEAQEILDEATEQSFTIRAKNLADAQATQDRLISEAEKEGEALVVRAKSNAAMTRRNIELAAKNEMIERAFSKAMQELYDMDRERYGALLLSLLCKTLNAQRESERESMRLYGEDISPAFYELLLNARDHADIAKPLMNGVHLAASSGKIPSDMAAKLYLGVEPIDIDGGLVLRCGNIENNCAFSMLLASIRPELEPRVQQILYKDQIKA